MRRGPSAAYRSDRQRTTPTKHPTNVSSPPGRSYPASYRIVLLQFTVLIVFVIFGLRLWRLQAVAGTQYEEMARRNRTRLTTTDAPRGVMYDRTGELLVRNVPRFNVLLIPAYLPDDEAAQEAILERLHKLLDIPMASDLEPPPFPPYYGSAKWGLRDTVDQGALYAPYEPIILKQDVSRETAFIIEQEHLDLPGVLIEIDAYREYLSGDLTTHLLGYMGPIPAGTEDRYGQEQGYNPNDMIGLAGLEYSYEDELRGKKGRKTIEVDVAGREVRTVGQPVSPVSGLNLMLTLDLDLQGFVHDTLENSMRQAGSNSAVAIVTHVNTGQVLAMVSLPTFDNNLFAEGISTKDFVRLNADPAHPLLNHAIAGLYPPGSTFKMVAASAALEEEIVNRWTRLTCPANSGIMLLPNKYYPDNPALAQPFYCWTHKWGYGHGNIDFISAVAASCDIYFYMIGGGMLDRFEGLGLDRLRSYAEAFGYGIPSGIDLPAEAAGLVPGEKWKRVNYGERWTTGDTYNMTIGQGSVLATPLQVVQATAAVANGGTVYEPRLVYQFYDADGNLVRDLEPSIARQLPISEENLKLVREGMRAVVLRGTAEWLQVGRWPDTNQVLEVAAKTGTAEFCAKYPDCLDEDGTIKTAHAWFTAFAPYDDPEIAVVVFVYGGGEGAVTAMPVAAQILNYYFQLY
jgi:penicillin-binding protein 2